MYPLPHPPTRAHSQNPRQPPSLLPASPAWQQGSHRWSCSSQSRGRTARSSSSSAGPQRAASIAEGRESQGHSVFLMTLNHGAKTLSKPCGSLWPLYLWPHAMWDAGQHQGTELLRAGQRDCNLVPGEIPHVVVMGELQVGLPPQPLWSILQQRGARQQTGARLTTFCQETAEGRRSEQRRKKKAFTTCSASSQASVFRRVSASWL